MSALAKEWDIYYIASSYVTSALSSYVTLQLIEEIALSPTRLSFFLWLLASAVTFGGCSVWSMHFIGMVAIDVSDRQKEYNIGLTIASLLMSIIFVFIALFLVATSVRVFFETNDRLEATKRVWLRIVCGAFIMGGGVVTMHYIGMMALHVENTRMEYNTAMVALSVFIAITISLAALYLLFFLQGVVKRIVIALILGLAVVSMHYTGMAAAQFYDHPGAHSTMKGLVIKGNEWGYYIDMGSEVLRLIMLGIVFSKAVVERDVLKVQYSKMRYHLIGVDPKANYMFPPLHQDPKKIKLYTPKVIKTLTCCFRRNDEDEEKPNPAEVEAQPEPGSI